MKSVTASYKIIPLPNPNDKIAVLKHLETIGRTCYKSEDRISEYSCMKFIKMLRDRKHWAMLEHYIFPFSVPKYIIDDILDPSRFTPDNVDLINRMPYIQCTYWEDAPYDDWKYMISASATALNYLWECECYKNDYNAGLVKLCNFMMERYPELMKDPMGNRDIYLDNPKIRFIDREELKYMPRNVRLVHDSISVKFTVDRGVTNELVRHRPASWAQESTRYCNYSSGKFGNEITVIDPLFFPPETEDEKESIVHRIWRRSMDRAQDAYNDLIDCGAAPQQARTVLPQSTKAEITMTARMFEMRHFFNMRADTPAHPQMQEVAYPLLEDLVESEPNLFGDMAWKVDEYYKEDNNG